MTPEVVCMGHIAVDAISHVADPPPRDGRVVARDGRLASGGPAATAAVTLARLGVEVAFIGTVGDDDAGRLAIADLDREGVETSRVRIASEPTALSTIVVDGTGHRAIAAFNGGSAVPALSAVDIAMLRAARWVHVDHIGATAIREIRHAGVRTPISVDAGNPIEGLPLAEVDLFAPTEERLLARYDGHDVESAIRQAVADGPRVVVATRGAAGAIAGERTGAGGSAGSDVSIVEVPGFKVDVVSTLGAGDVFHGALLGARCRGLDLLEAVRLANAAAALACRALDGRSAIAGWDETLAFAASAGPNRTSPRGSEESVPGQPSRRRDALAGAGR